MDNGNSSHLKKIEEVFLTGFNGQSCTSLVAVISQAIVCRAIDIFPFPPTRFLLSFFSRFRVFPLSTREEWLPLYTFERAGAVNESSFLISPLCLIFHSNFLLISPFLHPWLTLAPHLRPLYTSLRHLTPSLRPLYVTFASPLRHLDNIFASPLRFLTSFRHHLCILSISPLLPLNVILTPSLRHRYVTFTAPLYEQVHQNFRILPPVFF